MKVKINKSIANGTVKAQPSKSYAHRLLIACALSSKESVINNIVLSNDIIATINCIKALGKEVIIEGDYIKTIIIKNNNGFNINEKEEIVFDCLESGSTLRFFIPIALLTGKKVKFIGTEKLLSRGLSVYEDICLKQNINYTKDSTSISFDGILKNGEFNIPGNISSQFITGLLLALPLLNGDSIINITTNYESKNYIDITLDVLKKAGINIDIENNKYYIKGNQRYIKSNYLVEGDYSNAAFLEVFNYLGGNVELIGLNKDSYQGDKIYQKYFELLNNCYQELDISNCIDLGPILFAFASMKHGAKFTNTSRLKIKESDRISAVNVEISKFGAKLNDFSNFIVVNEQILRKPENVLFGQNDHRIVMMLSVMASVYGGTIEGIEAVNKSYPHFFKDLESLGIEVHYDVD
jgi:3-phosphoshikimate 1-carboxyvinyltransferase